MIYHLKHHEINFNKWDALAKEQAIPYACSWYLNIVSPNWEALILDDYKAIMPLTCKKKLGINYLAQPFFTQQSGVFGKNLSTNIVHQFIAEIEKRYSYIDINLNEGNSQFLKEDKNIQTQTNILLELNKPFNTLLKNFSENTRRMIKKAEKLNITILEQNNADELIELFKNTKGKKLKHLNYKAYNNLKSLIKSISQHYKVSIKTIHQGEILLGGAVFVSFNNRIIFFFSALSDLGKQCGAMHYLIADTIKYNCEQNKMLDFEGSNNVNLARFYKSFGSKEVVYLRYKNNKLPYPIKWIKK
ncbi:MAG: hypothetical protein ACK4ON_03710 [Bacteroidia bacterium]